MKYTFPDYYPGFSCLAGECPATCCEYWQIVIDPRSLQRYRQEKGSFGRRLRKCIDWKEGVFKQEGHRCAFLNADNLCDMHLEAGAGMMCRTCRMHPRHVEVYDNEREIMLALSCPAAARLILGQTEPARRVSFEDERTDEENDEFDFFLHSALQDARDVIIDMLQNRQESLQLRMARVLVLTHDVQKRINEEAIFEIGAVLERYTRTENAQPIREKILSMAGEQAFRAAFEKSLLEELRGLEQLDPTWSADLERWCSLRPDGSAGDPGEKQEDGICFDSAVRYLALCEKMKPGTQENRDGKGWEIRQEQLAVYFVQTYFCSALYDHRVLAKSMLAVISVLIWRLLCELEGVTQGGGMTDQKQIELAFRYSRELEHSNLNMQHAQRWGWIRRSREAHSSLDGKRAGIDVNRS